MLSYQLLTDVTSTRTQRCWVET